MRLSYSIVFVLSFLLSLGCEQDASGPVEIRGIIPALYSVAISPSVVNTDTINVGAERKPTDLLTIPVRFEATASAAAEIIRVRVTQQDPVRELTFAELRNDGIIPDVSGSDSVYTGIVSLQIQRSLIGTLTAEALAVSSAGDESSALLRPIAIVRLNRPPVLSNLQAPSVVTPSPTEPTFLITVQVSDPDGNSDIRIVFRRPPNANAYLNDSQVNGDRLAGDGIYTETVSVQPAPAPGLYLFQFRAVDRSGDSSNILYHTIEIQ